MNESLKIEIPCFIINGNSKNPSKLFMGGDIEEQITFANYEKGNNICIEFQDKTISIDLKQCKNILEFLIKTIDETNNK